MYYALSLIIYPSPSFLRARDEPDGCPRNLRIFLDMLAVADDEARCIGRLVILKISFV